MSLFQGAGVALVTPFTEEKDINYEELERLIEFQINSGIDSIIVCGTTGEPVTMTEEERLSVISYTIEKEGKRVPVIAGTGGNCTEQVVTFSKRVEDAGADGISAINTLLGMKIDIDKRRPILANNTGGFSGPAVKPVAVRCVHQIANAVNIPVLGLGGIMSGDDAIEFMLAGATAVSIGTGNFADPEISIKTIEGIERYMKKHNIDDINSIIGTVQMN